MLIRISTVIMIILFMCPLQCGARIIKKRPVAEDFKLADYVAYVLIEKTENMYTLRNQLCNVKCTATVIDAIKGVSSGDTLEWNSLGGPTDLEIGSLCIVFLAKPDRFCEPEQSPNCIQESLGADDKLCVAVVESNRVVHWGLAIMAVGHFVEEWDQTVRVYRVIELPKSLQTKPQYAGANQPTGIYSWVKLEDMLRYLKSLQP